MRISEFDRPGLSDEIETAQTVAYMDELAAADAGDRLVLDALDRALSEASIDLSATPEAIARAVYWFLKRTIRYVPTPGTSPLVDQTLIAPSTVLAMPEPIGDCPQFSMLAKAMLRAACVTCYFVTIAAEAQFPDQYSHVYNAIETAPGRLMPFDSSNGPEPGAEYARPYKRKVWAHLDPDKCSRTGAKETTTAMMHSTYRPVPPGMRSRSLRGALGDTQCDSDGNCWTDGVLSSPQYVDPSESIAPVSQQDADNDAAGRAALGLPASSGGGSGWSSFFSTLANDATQIGTSLLRQSVQQKPYLITNAAGQSVLYNPNTGTVANTATPLSTVNTTYLVLGVAAIAALAFLGKK